MDASVPVKVSKLRTLQQLALAATNQVHSNGYLPRADKVAILATLKRIRKALDDELQMSLFSPQQREG